MGAALTDEFRPIQPTKGPGLRAWLSFRWKQSWVREAIWRVWYFLNH